MSKPSSADVDFAEAILNGITFLEQAASTLPPEAREKLRGLARGIEEAFVPCPEPCVEAPKDNTVVFNAAMTATMKVLA